MARSFFVRLVMGAGLAVGVMLTAVAGLPSSAKAQGTGGKPGGTPGCIVQYGKQEFIGTHAGTACTAPVPLDRFRKIRILGFVCNWDGLAGIVQWGGEKEGGTTKQWPVCGRSIPLECTIKGVKSGTMTFKGSNVICTPNQ
jgi:hypothetical protein